MQSMHNDNTTAVLVCVLFNVSLCPSLFDSPLQGLAHLKAEQGTPFFSFLTQLFFCFFFTHCLAWFWAVCAVGLRYLSVCICVLQCSSVAAEKWEGLCVCVCVCIVRVRMHSGSACSSSHLRLSLSLSLSLLLCLLTLVSPRFLHVT